jgi:hypothetical protein
LIEAKASTNSTLLLKYDDWEEILFVVQTLQMAPFQPLAALMGKSIGIGRLGFRTLTKNDRGH